MTIYELCLLHSRADRALRTVIAEQLQPHDLTMMQWLLLGVVGNAPKDGVSMSEIAEQMGITLPQVTALLSDLTKRRLTKLKTQRRDRRSRHALLTPKGEEVMASANDTIETGLAELFPSDRRQTYGGMLEYIIPGETESVIVDVTLKEQAEI